MGSSVADSIEIGEWIDDTSSEQLPTLDDALNNVNNFDESVSFLDGSESSPSRAPPTSNLLYRTDPGVFFSRLESQSHQLSSLVNKSGNPACICESKGLLAIGGSRGMIMLFNSEGRLETFFPGGSESGSVGCVSFSNDGRLLAAGYGRGMVKVFNIKKRSLIHTIRDAVQPGAGLLQVIYLDSNNDFLTLDTAGNVFEVRIRITLTRKLTHSVRCVFSGCNGEVVSVKSMSANLLVLMTMTKILIVSTQKGGAVFCAFPVNFNEQYPPLFDFHLYQDTEKKVIRICICRGTKLSLFVLHPDKFGTPQKVAVFVRSIQLPVEAIALCWINPNGIIVFDQTGESMLVNPETGLVTQGLEKELPLVFSTFTYKACESGGNISAAMSVLAERTCYQSVCSSDESLFLLTHEGLYVVRSNNELDQLARYKQRGDTVSPCLFLLDLLKGRLKTTFCTRPKLEHLLRTALEDLTNFIFDNSVSPDGRKYIQTLLHACVEGSQQSFLYEYVWTKLEAEPSLRNAFLESLDEFVLDGNLQFAPPTLISAYFIHLINEGHFSQLQAAICRFPIHSIDIHMVITVCRQNNLFDGVIHVMNKALLDYIGPLEEMLDSVSQFASNDVHSDSELEQGNRLLLYIQCCLAGHGYPIGELPQDLKEKVPLDVYRCITSLRGKDGSSSSLQYPYMRFLLLFDAQQFFHVITTCLDSQLFKASEGRLQRLIDMLGEICDSVGIMDVIVQYLIMVIRLVDNNRIVVPIDLLERCVCSLLRLPSLPESAENTVIDVMERVPQLDRQLFLRLSQNPFRSQICCFIYFSQRSFIKILKAFLSGAQNKLYTVFLAVKKILSAELTKKELSELTSFLKSHLKELSNIDSVQTATMLLNDFPDFYSSIYRQDVTTSKHFDLIKASFEIRRERQENFLTGEEELDEGLFDIYFKGLVEVCHYSDQELKEVLTFWLPMGSRNDFCLNLVMPVENYHTGILLLEARGFTHRAFDLVFGKISSASSELDMVMWIDQLLHLVSRHTVEANEQNWLIRSFREVVKLCRDSSDREMDSRLVTLLRKTMSGGSHHASELFSCLLGCQSFRDGNLSQTRSVIVEMLSSCQYEKLLLTMIVRTMEYENSTLLENFCSQSFRRAHKLIIHACHRCQSSTVNKASYVYGCGHTAHIDCDSGTRTCSCSKQRDVPKSVHLLRNKPPVHKREVFVKWNEELRLVP